MSDHSWVLSGVDAATRQRVTDAAAHAGQSVQAFLAELLLATADEPGPHPDSRADEVGNFPYRHRLEALERRLDHGLAGLEAGLRGADGAISSLVARVADAEDLTGRGLTASEVAAAESAREVNALRDSLEAADGRVALLARHHEAARNDLAARLAQSEDQLASVEELTRAAAHTGALLGEAQESLRQGVSDDLAALALHGAARLDSSLAAVRAEAKNAAAQADAALRALVEEFHGAQTRLERRFAETDALTHSRIQAAFEDALARLQTFDARLTSSETAARAAAEANTAELRRLGAALKAASAASAHELLRSTAGLQTEIGETAAVTRTALAGEIAGLRARQEDEQRRLAQLGADLDNAAGETAALRRSFNAFAANSSGKLAETAGALRAEVARVEACTLAALEKLAADIAAGDGKLARAAEAHANDSAGKRQQMEAELAALHGQHAGMMARLQLLDRTLGMLDLANSDDAPVAERLAAIEQTRQDADQALTNLHEDFASFVDEVEREHTELLEALARANDNSTAEQAVGALQAEFAALTAGNQQTQTVLFERLTSERGGIEQTLAELRRDLGAATARSDRQQATDSARLEQMFDRAAPAQAVAELRLEIAALGGRLGDGSIELAQDIAALRTRQDSMHGLQQEDAGRLHEMARILTRLAAQQSEGAEMSDDRLRLIAQAIAELEQSQNTEAAVAAALERRLAELEARQSGAIETLGLDLSIAFGEHSRRLEAVESANHAGPILESVAALLERRLAEFEPPDFAAAFEALRQRVEERVLDMERRSVRTLEQVSETVALLEQQFLSGDEDAVVRSA